LVLTRGKTNAAVEKTKMNVWMMVGAAGLLAVSLALVISGVLAYSAIDPPRGVEIKKSMDTSG
jgi:hypothetical protein